MVLEKAGEEWDNKSIKEIGEGVERETGVEPATSTLARSHSTTELFPLSKKFVLFTLNHDFCQEKIDMILSISRLQANLS